MMMMMTIVLLAVLFMVGLINCFFYVPPKKFLGWIRSFRPKTSLVDSAATTISPKEKTAHEKDELERVFATFDKNGDGFITKQELRDSFKKIGLSSTENELGSIVEKLDANGDGLIDVDEFFELYAAMGRKQVGGKDEEGVKEEEEEDLREAFEVFDGDRDGLISVEELDSVLSSLGLKQGMRIEDCKEMIRKVDMDGDGMVNFDEFKKMMKTGGRLVEVS